MVKNFRHGEGVLLLLPCCCSHSSRTATNMKFKSLNLIKLLRDALMPNPRKLFQESFDYFANLNLRVASKLEFHVNKLCCAAWSGSEREKINENCRKIALTLKSPFVSGKLFGVSICAIVRRRRCDSLQRDWFIVFCVFFLCFYFMQLSFNVFVRASFSSSSSSSTWLLFFVFHFHRACDVTEGRFSCCSICLL